MSALVISQIETSVLFGFNSRLHIIPTVLGLFSNKSGFWRSQKTKLRGLRYLKMTLPILQVFEKPNPIPLSLCHI